jgi:ferric-dicitrate binding protein FerR (iron transport regulator)
LDNLTTQLHALLDNPAWTAQEHAAFLELLNNYSPAELQAVFQENYIAKLSQIGPVDKAQADRLLEQIHERLELQPALAPLRAMPPRRLYRWWAVAAMLVLLAGLGITLLVLNKQATNKPTVAQQKPTDVAAPATTRAMITLSNGAQVYLDSAASGQLAQQGNVNVIKQAGGAIAYNAAATGEAAGYNTLSNPRGSNVVHLTLADGTQVWLNAESSLRYPVAFSGPERSVEITGEAYFEVAHNAHKPLKVRKAGGDWAVQVLGTHFNVNAYTDEEAVRVTLLEGAVKLSAGQQQGQANNLILKPGEQGVLNSVTLSFSKGDHVDVDAVMAWKAGFFEFSDTELPIILRQLSRWYNINIQYQDKPNHETFGGRISRNLPLSNVLQLLKNNGAVFTLDGNTLIVKP